MHHNSYSAYTLDPEHGWIATHRLPLESAIRYSLDHKERNAGTIVAVVPDGANPDLVIDSICRAMAGFPQSPLPILDLDECYDGNGTAYPYGRCDTCGLPCDENGCTQPGLHAFTSIKGYGKAR